MSSSNWRRFYPSHIDLWELDQSSNDTESDIPGHGRLLGKAYQAIGKRVESISGRIAARCGLGPNAVAIRISRRASQAQKRAWDLWGLMHANGRILYDAKEEELQKKDVKRLVRYTKSKTELTRKQALDHIVDSIIKHEHISSFLEACGATQFIERQEPFIWDYFDASIQVRSRLAISFLQEKKLRKFIEDVKTHSLDHATKTLNLLSRDTEELCFAMRLATRYLLMHTTHEEEKLNWFLQEVVSSLQEKTEAIEWSEIDRLFTFWFWNNYSARETCCRNRNMTTLWDMISLKENLPGTFQSAHYNIWHSALKYPRDTKPRLEGPSKMWKRLRYSHQFLGGVLASPSSKGVKWMGRRLGMPFLNDADEIFSRIAYKWGRRDDSLSLDSAYISSCKELASLVDSADAELKSRAILCIRPILCHDQYSSKILLDALAHTSFFGTAEYDELVSPIRSRMIAMRTAEELYVKRIYRHCNSQGHLLHLLNKPEHPEEVAHCQGICAFEDVLQLDFEDLIFISSLPESASTWAELSPKLIHVGTFPNGQDAYLAEGSLSDKAFCLTSNGLPEPLHNAYISTIRYPFDTFGASRFLGTQSGEEFGDYSSCMDPTGPYGWKFVRYLSGIDGAADEDELTEIYASFGNDKDAHTSGKRVGGDGTMWPFDEVKYQWEETFWINSTSD